MFVVPTKFAVRNVEVPLFNDITGVCRSRSENAVVGTFRTEFIETVTVPNDVLPSKKYGGLLGMVTFIL